MPFVSGATVGNNGGSTNSFTGAFTVSTNPRRALIAQVACSFDPVNFTGITYSGAAMTSSSGGLVSGVRGVALWYLLNPASGSNNIVVSSSVTGFIAVVAGEWREITGFDAGQYDADPTGEAAFTSSITSVHPNVVAIISAVSDGVASAPTLSGGTIEFTASDNSSFLGDTASVQVPTTFSFTSTFPTMTRNIIHNKITLLANTPLDNSAICSVVSP